MIVYYTFTMVIFTFIAWCHYVAGFYHARAFSITGGFYHDRAFSIIGGSYHGRAFSITRGG